MYTYANVQARHVQYSENISECTPHYFRGDFYSALGWHFLDANKKTACRNCVTPQKKQSKILLQSPCIHPYSPPSPSSAVSPHSQPPPPSPPNTTSTSQPAPHPENASSSSATPPTHSPPQPTTQTVPPRPPNPPSSPPSPTQPPHGKVHRARVASATGSSRRRLMLERKHWRRGNLRGRLSWGRRSLFALGMGRVNLRRRRGMGLIGRR